jgi:hypothetical protein
MQHRQVHEVKCLADQQEHALSVVEQENRVHYFVTLKAACCCSEAASSLSCCSDSKMAAHCLFPSSFDRQLAGRLPSQRESLRINNIYIYIVLIYKYIRKITSIVSSAFVGAFEFRLCHIAKYCLEIQ